MARIRVLNKQTGQSGTISEEFYNPDKYDRLDANAVSPQNSLLDKVSSSLPLVGAGIGGVASLPLGPLAPVGAAAGYLGGRAIEGGINRLRGINETPAEIPKAVGGALGSAGTAFALQKGTEALPVLTALAKGGFTPQGASKLAEKGAEKGENFSMADVVSGAKKGIISPDLIKKIEEFAAQYQPDQLGESLLTSPKGLAIRREITNKFGGFGNLVPGAEEVRNSLSSLLHQNAPGTVIPDKLYSLYANPGLFHGGILPGLGRAAISLGAGGAGLTLLHRLGLF